MNARVTYAARWVGSIGMMAAMGCGRSSDDPLGACECTEVDFRERVTNSSVVVPAGSFQSENGVNISGRGGAEIFDGTNSRLRLGIAPCLEVLLDVPTYVAPVAGRELRGLPTSPRP